MYKGLQLEIMWCRLTWPVADAVKCAVSVGQLFANPQHAYTKGLLSSIPRIESERKSHLNTIPGQVASIQDFVSGCRFCQRMERGDATILRQRPDYREINSGHWVETCPQCFKV